MFTIEMPDTVKRDVKVSGGSLIGTHYIPVTYILKGTPKDFIVDKFLGNRVIALQNATKKLPEPTVEQMVKDGIEIHVLDCGRKPETRDEVVGRYTSMGLPEWLANMAFDDPERFTTTMASMNKPQDDNV